MLDQTIRTLSVLEVAFPVVPILCGSFESIDPQNHVKVLDELEIAGICGSHWTEISLDQARSTWDVLFYISPKFLTCLLPGYLQWLWDPNNADVLATGLPKIVMRVLASPRTEGPSLSDDQIRALHMFFTQLAAVYRDIDRGSELSLIEDTVELCMSKVSAS